MIASDTMMTIYCPAVLWRQKMADYAPWFKEQNKSKANESLRPGSPKTADDLFGMDGTFRKLAID